MDYESLDLLGAPFQIVDTYVYYEGPKAFAMRSMTMPDLYYVVTTVDERDNGDLVALAAAVDGERYRAIRSGLVTFREAFTEAHSRALSVVTWHWSDEEIDARSSIDSISASDLTDSWLPIVGRRLQLQTDTIQAFDPQELLGMSDAQNRTIFAVEIAAAGVTRTELPLRVSGEVQVFLGGGIEGTLKQIARKAKSTIAREIMPLAIGNRAASYVFLMAIDSASMLEPVEFTGEALGRWDDLIGAMGSTETDRFLELLKAFPPPVRNNFRRLLKVLTSIDSGVSMSSVLAFTQTLRVSTASASQVRTAVAAIEGAKPKVRYVTIQRGILTGHVLHTRAFVLIDLADAFTYRGHMESDASIQANGFPVGDASYVTGVIRVETAFASEDEATGTNYFLESIERIEQS
jgi:hypothetical protein